MKRIACFTLDIEPDYGQDHILTQHLVDEILIQNEESLGRLFKPLDIKLTAFVVGKTLEENPHILESFRKANAEVELHSYSHLMSRDREADVTRGIDVFEDVVGHVPLGYRAPQGAISQEELSILDRNEVKFDSSVFPFFRLGRYSHFQTPQEPYFIRGSSMLEFPIASIPSVRLPIAMSYMMILGWSRYETLIKYLGLPKVLIFDFHLHDIFPSPAFAKLSTFWQVIYNRIYRQSPWNHFKAFVHFLRNKGYEFMHMKELYDITVESNNPIVL